MTEALRASPGYFGKIICVFNEKGGSGKSTSSCQLAGTLGLRGFKVLLADLDRQETASIWASMHEGRNFPADLWGDARRYGAAVTDKLREKVEQYDVVVADCPPGVEQPGTWAMLLVADLIIIPTKLNMQDVTAVRAAKLMVQRAWEAAGVRAPVLVLPTQAHIHLHHKDDVATLAKLEQDADFPLLPPLADRKAISRSMAYGSSVHRVPRSGASIEEVEEITDRVLKTLGLPAKMKRKAAQQGASASQSLGAA